MAKEANVQAAAFNDKLEFLKKKPTAEGVQKVSIVNSL